MSQILLGVALACVGVGLTGAALAWVYFGLRLVLGSGLYPAFQTYFRIQYGLFAAETVVSSVGFYLILAGILRILPRASLWSRVGPPLVLVGGLLSTLVTLEEFFTVPYIFPPFAGSLPDWVGELTFAVGVTASVVGALGTILSLVAIARGALARWVSPSPTPLT